MWIFHTICQDELNYPGRSALKKSRRGCPGEIRTALNRLDEVVNKGYRAPHVYALALVALHVDLECIRARRRIGSSRPELT